MESLTDVLTGEPFREPVILACGHTFSSEPLLRWWHTSEKRICPMCRQEVALEYRAIPNFIVGALCEESQQLANKQELFFLYKNSLEHIKPGMRFSQHCREVHNIRLFVLELAKRENVVLFGGTVVEHRSISQAFDAMEDAVLDGAPISKRHVFAPYTDLDLAFRDKDTCHAFLATLRAALTIEERPPGQYGQLQGLQVISVKASFFRNRKPDRLRVDLVYEDDSRGIGLRWPDFAERMVACDLQEPRYVLNPLLSPVFYAHCLTGGNLLEHKEDRFVRSLLRRIDDQSPLQWCLLAPDAFASLPNQSPASDQLLLYKDYVTSLLGRLDKALRRGSLVAGIAVAYDRERRDFTMPCGHLQCRPTLLRDVEWRCNTEAMHVLCDLTAQEHLFFKLFWPISLSKS